MVIGIIGVGVVGSAIKQGFQDLGHIIKIHDIKLNTTIENVLDTDIIYLCLPTNSDIDGSCNIKEISKTIKLLSNKKYKGIIAIKSTIIPGTYTKLTKLFDKERLCTVPEFLREKHAVEDFKNNHNVLVIGTNNEICASARSGEKISTNKFVYLKLGFENLQFSRFAVKRCRY